jgi:PIN domain nuclease of toxin-antitoxin system
MPTAERWQPLLLDTHCWLWMEFGRAELFSRTGLSAIKEATAKKDLLVSVISVWEVGMLESKGRIHLYVSCEDWVKRALANPAVTLVSLSPDIALDSTRLPGDFHGDPADQILAATARRLGARILTRDRQLTQYGRQGYIKVVPA